MEVKLVVASGTAKGREIPLPITMLTIGRGKRCHLRPHCQLVSKLHCAIARWAGKVVVRDLKSSNGTYINGERIHGEVRVKDGDTLQIGTLQFAICIHDSLAQELPVQVVRPGDIRWLMESGDGSSVLKVSETSRDVDLTTLFKAAAALAGEARDDKFDLSAGDYLREYFRHGEAAQ